MKIAQKPNFGLLAQQLIDGGFPHGGLIGNEAKAGGYEVFTLDAAGERLDFPPEAQAIMDAHVAPPPPAKVDTGTDVPTDQIDRLATSVDTLRAYLALSSPTNAQTIAAFKLLIRMFLFLLKQQGY